MRTAIGSLSLAFGLISTLSPVSADPAEQLLARDDTAESGEEISALVKSRYMHRR